MKPSPSLLRARQIITDWRNTPAPLAGKIDTDRVLAELIAAELESTTSQTEPADASAKQRAAIEAELATVRAQLDRMLASKLDREAKLNALADRLETQTFGGGIATEQDLYGIANGIREILLET